MAETSAEERREILGDLFNRWDLDGNGAVTFSELMQVLQASERMTTKDRQKFVRKIEAQIQQGRKQHSSMRRPSATSLKLQSGGTINFAEADGEPSLDPEAFTNFLFAITAKDTEEEFKDFVEFCKTGCEEAIEDTQGNRIKKMVWDMFQLLDTNHDGFVDLDELEVLLKTEKKADKKHVAKWKAYLYNKGRDANKVAEDVLFDPTATVRQQYQHRMHLRDFQAFIVEYTGGSEEKHEEHVGALLSQVETAVQEKQVQYIVEFKVQDIMNDIMGDLLKERPKDVLAGVARSVQRLQRTGKYPKPFANKPPQ